MKLKQILCIVLCALFLSGCSGINLDNIHEQEFKYKYSKITLSGDQKETTETFTVDQAMEFTTKYLSVLYNRAADTASGEEERLLYSDEYIEKVGNVDDYFANLRDFYSEYDVKTELSKTEIDHVIMVGGDAYVNVTAYVSLKNALSDSVAKQIGFKNGIGGTNTAEFNMKLKYENKEYKLYDMESVENEGSLTSFAGLAGTIEYETVEERTETVADITVVDDTEKLSEEEISGGQVAENTHEDATNQQKIAQVRNFINDIAYRQHNRNYQTLAGNEDYPLLSSEYIAELNKTRDDVSYTKEVYQALQLTTEVVGVSINEIQVKKDAFVVSFDVTTRITSCISEDRAKQIGYTGGIGSTGTMSFVYTIREIDGSLKLVNSVQTR